VKILQGFKFYTKKSQTNDPPRFEVNKKEKMRAQAIPYLFTNDVIAKS
jgi:hypothetical protein